MDDEILLREVTSKILKSSAYNVITTVNKEEALKIFMLDYEKNREISGLLLDLTIQGGFGGKDIIDEIISKPFTRSELDEIFSKHIN